MTLPSPTLSPTPPPYTATDYGLVIAGILMGAGDMAEMFGFAPVDKATRGLAINALSAMLGAVVVSFTAHRGVKHVAALATGR